MIQPGNVFKDNLAQMPGIEGIARIDLIDGKGAVVASIENKPGKQGSAYLLNGTSNYIDLGNPAPLNLTSAVTVGAWINPTNSLGTQVIVGRGSGANKMALSIVAGNYVWGNALVSATEAGADESRMLAISRMLYQTPSLRARSYEKHLGWYDTLVPELKRRLGDDPHATLRAKTIVGCAITCLDIAGEAWMQNRGRVPLMSYFDTALETIRTDEAVGPERRQRPQRP